MILISIIPLKSTVHLQLILLDGTTPSADMAAAIDLEYITGHVRGSGAGQEEDQASKVWRRSYPSSWLSWEHSVCIVLNAVVAHP